MSDLNRTTSRGTVITLEREHGEDVIILTNPLAPPDLRRTEAGRVLDGGFQPAPFSAWALGPEALRIIADILEGR